MTKDELINKISDIHMAIRDLQVKIQSVLDDIESISMMLDDIPDPLELDEEKVN